MPDPAQLLLVEDDRQLASMLEQILVGEGYQVDVARDGQRGLHLGLTRTYDVIVLDRGLPAIEGLDLLGRLRSKGVVTPALVLSALGNPADRVAGLDAGAEDYMSKPFDVDELAARLRALRRRRYEHAASLPVPAGTLDVEHAPGHARVRRAGRPLGAGVLAARAARPAPAAGVQPGRDPRPGVHRGRGRGRRRHLRLLPAPQAGPGERRHRPRRRVPAGGRVTTRAHHRRRARRAAADGPSARRADRAPGPRVPGRRRRRRAPRGRPRPGRVGDGPARGRGALDRRRPRRPARHVGRRGVAARALDLRRPAGQPPGPRRDAGGGPVGRGRVDARRPPTPGTVRVLTGSHDGDRSCRPRWTRPRRARSWRGSSSRCWSRAPSVSLLAGLGAVWLTRRAVQPMVGRAQPAAAVRRRREPRAAHPAHPALDARAAAGPAPERRLGRRLAGAGAARRRRPARRRGRADGRAGRHAAGRRRAVGRRGARRRGRARAGGGRRRPRDRAGARRADRARPATRRRRRSRHRCRCAARSPRSSTTPSTTPRRAVEVVVLARGGRGCRAGARRRSRPPRERPAVRAVRLAPGRRRPPTTTAGTTASGSRSSPRSPRSTAAR